MHVGFLLFDDCTQLDFTGPFQVLSRIPRASLHLIARTLAPVRADCGLQLVPTITADACPPLDLLCVPGGFGVQQVLEDPALLQFVRRQGASARYVCSVCTGAFVLGAAGLLGEVRATTHWSHHHLLSRVGAIPVRARVVRDGRIFTGAGVTAGIDFALTLLEEICGEARAREAALALEYDPQPPFDAGTPETAGTAVTEVLTTRYAPKLAQLARTLDALRAPGAVQGSG
jgi:cyclohexyl-isocyanide hydratase